MKTKVNALFTKWGRELDKTNPLPNYPRPQMVRDNWQSLNGIWQYAITQGCELPHKMDGDIVVPFSPETRLSGVERQILPGEYLWYKREFEVKKLNNERILLHFGAVDQIASVECNGHLLGVHEGGYWPFSFDITDYIADINTLTIRVTDNSNLSDEAYGKQSLERGGIWYTSQSGIWQTVWLEAVPISYISNIRITPLYDEMAVHIAINLEGETDTIQAEVFDEGVRVAGGSFNSLEFTVPLKNVKFWSPDIPFLYTLLLKTGEDSVTSYFAMRKFGTIYDKNGIKRMTLNNKIIFCSGLLDQGYWSDGMYTPPAEEAIINELSAIKELGFNMLRKHIKIEPLRWYYHCDRLGILVWQDFVNGGGKYSPMVTQVLPFIGIRLNDTKHTQFARNSPNGRDNFERDMHRTVDLLYSQACIMTWVPFNEGWGQYDSARITAELVKLDNTRLIDAVSGWHDQGVGDFCSKHIYYRPYRLNRDKYARLQCLSEFGGYSSPTQGHMSSARLFGYKMFKNKQELTAGFKRLYVSEVLPAIKEGLCAAIYTQLSDVEDEINGVFTYDRAILKLDNDVVMQVNKELQRAMCDCI